MRLFIKLAFVALLAAAALPASATTVSPVTYYFGGLCSDCSGSTTGELVLQNYTPGQAVTGANFVSLHYDGSNLFSAFTIATPVYLAGELDLPLPGNESFYVSDAVHFFQTSVSGLWSVGNASFIFADMGTNGTYNPAAPTIPEPFSLGLLLTGLAWAAAARPRARW